MLINKIKKKKKFESLYKNFSISISSSLSVFMWKMHNTFVIVVFDVGVLLPS